MSNNLSSIGALAYQGTNATMPPNVFIFNNNQPAVTDWRNFALGDLWINRIQQNINNSEIYVLLGIASNRANWALLTNSNGNINHVTTDAGTVIPVSGNINLFGGHDINTSGSGSTIMVNLDNAIVLGDLAPITSGSNAVSATTGDINIAAGNLKIPATITSGEEGVIISGGFPFISNYGLYNTFVGQQSGNTTLTGSSNSSLGAFCLASLTTGVLNTAIGAGALSLITTSSSNCAVGHESLWILVSGSDNVAVGELAGGQLLTGSGNVLLGMQAGYGYDSSESNNVNIANQGMTGDSGIIRIGTSGHQDSCFVSGISGVSISSLTSSLPVQINSSGQLGATGNIYMPLTNAGGTQGVINADIFSFIHNGPPSSGSTFCGINAGNFAATGGRNSGFGYQSLDFIGSGLDNSACGQESLGTLAGGSTNSALGSQSGEFLVSGSGNLLLGFQSGVNYTGAESNNILLSHTGTLGESHIIRLGTAGTHLKNFQAGIVGITTDVADAIPVLVSSTGQLGTVSSSARYKANIHDLNGQSANIYKLRPVSFNYISHPEHEAWGLIAEEVEQVMPQLVVYNKDQQCETVKYQDLPVLLLNELQKMAKQNELLLKRIEALERCL